MAASRFGMSRGSRGPWSSTRHTSSMRISFSSSRNAGLLGEQLRGRGIGAARVLGDGRESVCGPQRRAAAGVFAQFRRHLLPRTSSDQRPARGGGFGNLVRVLPACVRAYRAHSAAHDRGVAVQHARVSPPRRPAHGGPGRAIGPRHGRAGRQLRVLRRISAAHRRLRGHRRGSVRPMAALGILAGACDRRARRSSAGGAAVLAVPGAAARHRVWTRHRGREALFGRLEVVSGELGLRAQLDVEEPWPLERGALSRRPRNGPGRGRLMADSSTENRPRRDLRRIGGAGILDVVWAEGGSLHGAL